MTDIKEYRKNKIEDIERDYEQKMDDHLQKLQEEDFHRNNGIGMKTKEDAFASMIRARQSLLDSDKLIKERNDKIGKYDPEMEQRLNERQEENRKRLMSILKNA